MISIVSCYTIVEMKLFYFQQQISYLLSLQINIFTPLVFILLFSAGILTSVNPCFISIIPLSLSYISSTNTANFDKNFFISGLINSFVILILITNFISSKYVLFKIAIPILSSLLMILVALNLLQILNFTYFFIHLNNTNIKLIFKGPRFKSYIIGSIIGFSVLPCSTTIMIIISFWLSHSIYIIYGLIYLLIYILGCIIPIFILLNLRLLNLNLDFISQLWNIIISISGSIILGLGLFSLLEKIFI
uniref:Thiol:disulfide interchange protein n=1 Tax=Inkyuleea mariana TaxID=123988 RepID=A0A4D6WZH8_9FLOR|nr:Thiol:disulfide interchange protein [Inkyuleea mariana]